MTSQTRDQWIRKAREEADRLWCYADLISDHPDLVERAISDGEAPEDFARELGEDLDLTPFRLWERGY